MFEFLDSDRSSSDLYPLVASLLPLDIKESAAVFMQERATRSKRPKWKYSAIQGLVGGILPVLNPFLQVYSDVLQFPGTGLLASLKSRASNEILTDPSWGVTTVKTQSFWNDLAVSASIQF